MRRAAIQRSEAGDHLAHVGPEVDAAPGLAGLVDRDLLEVADQVGRAAQVPERQTGGLLGLGEPVLEVLPAQRAGVEGLLDLTQAVGDQRRGRDGDPERRVDLVGDTGDQTAERGQLVLADQLLAGRVEHPVELLDVQVRGAKRGLRRHLVELARDRQRLVGRHLGACQQVHHRDAKAHEAAQQRRHRELEVRTIRGHHLDEGRARPGITVEDVRPIKIQTLGHQRPRLGVRPRRQVRLRFGPHPGRALVDDLVGVLVQQAAQRTQSLIHEAGMLRPPATAGQGSVVGRASGVRTPLRALP